MSLMVIFLLEILLENTEDFSVNSVVSYILLFFMKVLTAPLNGYCQNPTPEDTARQSRNQKLT